MECLGHETVTALNAAKGLTVPGGTAYAWVEAVTQSVRFTLDGTTTPTSTVGSILVAGDDARRIDTPALNNFSGIEVSASATLEVHYFR